MNAKQINNEIATKIIKSLDRGIIPWRKPWVSLGSNAAINVTTGKAYRGINIVMLGIEMLTKEYKHNQWLTFKQAKKAGGYVKRGQKSTSIYFWNFTEKKIEDKRTGEEVVKKIPFLRKFNVFNIEQCENIKPITSAVKTSKFKAVKEAEKIMSAYLEREAIEVKSGGDSAFYSPAKDIISIPHKKQFKSSSEYYSVLFHEAAHSTGHKTRLNRLTRSASFGNEDYSREELVAEFTAAFLCGQSGIIQDTIENSTAYIQSWKKVIKSDPSAVMFAATAAQRAFDFVMDIKTEKTEK